MFQSLLRKTKNFINVRRRNVKRHYSLRMKMTFTLIILVCLIIALIWIFNQLFLEEFYILSKIEILDNVYESVNESYNSEDKELDSDDIYEIQRFSEVKNVRVYVITDDLKLEYPQVDRDGHEYESIFSVLQDYFFRGINKDLTVEELENSENFNIYKLYDARIDASYVELIGTLDNNYIVYARTNLENIQENVAISNKFLAIVGLLAIIISGITMFYVSKKFTQPILKLSEISKKMSNLDFTVKYEVESDDEIGVLGESINTLSEKLELTISELKAANNELRLDLKNKIKVNERQQEFVSNVSHELKTPIAIIQGYAEGLKENVYEDEESRDYYCDVIIEEAGKMNQMVKRLISLSQLESGEEQIQFEHFDIVTLINSVLKSNSILFEQENIKCRFNQTEPVYVWGDTYLIEEVLNNYITNAINHAENYHSDNEKFIEIKLEEKEETVRIKVFNTGKNIPEEALDKVWDKFYKVDKARTREYGGSGIGLSIVKAVMESHNQAYGAENYKDGVEFWFELDTQLA